MHNTTKPRPEAGTHTTLVRRGSQDGPDLGQDHEAAARALDSCCSEAGRWVIVAGARVPMSWL